MTRGKLYNLDNNDLRFDKIPYSMGHTRMANTYKKKIVKTAFFENL